MSRGAGPVGRLHSEHAGIWSIQGREKHLAIAQRFLETLSVEDLLELPGNSTLHGAQTGRGASWELKAEGETRLFVKVLRKGGMAARLRGEFHGRSRLQAEMQTLIRALRRGVPTARLAFGATGKMKDGRVVALLATEVLEETRSLAQVLAGLKEADPDGAAGAAWRLPFMKAGAAVRLAHDAGLDHNDLNTGNILVAADPKPPPGRSPFTWFLGPVPVKERPPAYIIDLGDSRIGESLTIPRRASNLVRLLRSVEKHFGDSPTRPREVASFLRGYERRGSGEDARIDRTFRKKILQATRRRLPMMMLHRLGWAG